ncbi:MAG: hypothetical protein HOY78_32425, partial [Saccharothrix sp.]|nr:hypothetical protein [Saccharothrix sp.]
VVRAADWARAAGDGWDVLLAVSAALLFTGLALTFTVGIACTVLGTLGLLAGVAGARGAEMAAARARQGGDG